MTVDTLHWILRIIQQVRNKPFREDLQATRHRPTEAPYRIELGGKDQGKGRRDGQRGSKGSFFSGGASGLGGQIELRAERTVRVVCQLLEFW